MVSEKVHWLISVSLSKCGKIEWQRSIQAIAKAPDVAYEDILVENDSMWCVKDVIPTTSNLVVT